MNRNDSERINHNDQQLALTQESTDKNTELHPLTAHKENKKEQYRDRQHSTPFTIHWKSRGSFKTVKNCCQEELILCVRSTVQEHRSCKHRFAWKNQRATSANKHLASTGRQA
jgi:hypothetical protein